MTRLLRGVTVLLALALAAAACAPEPPAEVPVAEPEVEEPEPEPEEEPLPEALRGGQVAMVIAQGGLGDESYNDLAMEGFNRGLAATELGGTPIESPDIVAEGESVLRRAGEAGFELVITLEFTHGEILGPIAADFPEVNWAIVNIEVEGDNAASVLFEEQEGGYLAGALAAMMTSTEGIEQIDPAQKVVGVIGGTKSVGIDKFIVGFVEGARDVDPEVEVLVSYADDFGDPARGRALAEAMFEQGADIVYHVAGGTGAGVIEAAADANRFAIGVDTDQDFLAPGNVLTSMIKRVDVAVEELLQLHEAGEFPGGQTLTFGLAEDGVGLSEFRYTRDLIPDEYVERIEELRQQIIDGEIVPWNVITDGYPDFFE